VHAIAAITPPQPVLCAIAAVTPSQAGVVHAIAAVSQNGVIGRAGALPWNIPWDKAHFLAMTRGGMLVVGRCTFEETKLTYSADDGLSTQVVVVTARSLAALLNTTASAGCGQGTVGLHNGVAVAPSVAAAVYVARERWPASPVWLCGGSRVYEDAMRLRDPDGDHMLRTFHLTLVHADIADGDTFVDLPRLHAAFPESEVRAAYVRSGGYHSSHVILRREAAHGAAASVDSSRSRAHPNRDYTTRKLAVMHVPSAEGVSARVPR